MKLEKLEKFIKDELVKAGFTKSKYGEYQYKDINIYDISLDYWMNGSGGYISVHYCDSECVDDMTYWTAFKPDMKTKEIRKRLSFIKDNQGNLHKAGWCVVSCD